MIKQFLRKAGMALISASGGRILNSYEAASTGRRLGLWGASDSGPNAELLGNLVMLRNRSREVIRNNPHAATAVESIVANMVGTGIVPRWRLDNAELKAQIQSLWLAWTDEADFYEQQDFYGLQSLITRSLVESGEVLIRFQTKKLNQHQQIPFQLQVIEADHLDTSLNETHGNRLIRMGIEFNGAGKRVAYHLSRQHPGEDNASEGNKLRIPADQILHVYRILRPGQVRGVPWLTTILLRLYELDQYEDAELVRKKSAALFAAFVTKSVEGGSIGQPKGEDGNGNTVTNIEPGAVHYLGTGEVVNFSQPADVGSNYEAWFQQQLRSIASGIGVTYEQLTGDLRGVNYSSIRAGLLEFRRRIESLQHHLMVFQLCRPVASRWLDLAVASGAVSIPDYFNNRHAYQSVEWRPPAWDWVDPLKDVLAKQMEVRSGFKSRTQVAAERGQDIEDLDKQIYEDQLRAEEYGLAFDSDASQTNKTGTLQTASDEAIKSTQQE